LDLFKTKIHKAQKTNRVFNGNHMQTARKNVRNIMKKLFFGFFMLLLMPLVIFILPDWISVKIIIFLVIFKNWIGYTLLVIIVLWTLYWLIKDTQKIKKKSLIVLSAVAIGYAFIWIISLFHQSSYADCDYYTKSLNGGIKDFKGKKYTVKMCSTKFFWGDGSQVRLQILDDMGELKALRYFIFYWNDSADKELEYGDDVILYYDNSQSVPLKSLKMPPSKIDWIRARLPLFN